MIQCVIGFPLMNRSSCLTMLMVLLTQLPGQSVAEERVEHVYVGWRDQKIYGSQSVYYHSNLNCESASVDYGVDSKDLSETQTVSSKIKMKSHRRWTYVFDLEDLNPGRKYSFVLNCQMKDLKHSTQEYSFRALAPAQTLKFASGGDLGSSETARILLKSAVSMSPDFLLVGGDVSYATEDGKDVLRLWDKFFDMWEELVRSEDGALIPILVGIGNHDVPKEIRRCRAFWGWIRDCPRPMYFDFFPQSKRGRSYYERHFGNQLSVFLLDSDHYEKSKAQSDWLKRGLRQYSESDWRVVVYHVPMFPSYRLPESSDSRKVRKQWKDILLNNRADLVFEHHDHRMKRTKPLGKNKTVFLGDGAWGVEPRNPKSSSGEYLNLERTEAKSHFWFVELEHSFLKFQAVGVDGETFDECIVKRENDQKLIKCN